MKFNEGIVPAHFFFSGLVLVISIQGETMLEHNTLVQLPKVFINF